jgi:glycosyltransferase involved in cell wall biosynthesis
VSPPGFAEFLDEWRPDIVHFHALTLGAGLGHARLARERNIPYFVTYHTPTFSCPRGTLMHEGRTICDGRIEPVRCGSCVLHAQGWPRPLARLLAHSPLQPEHLPEGPWLPRLALPALIQDGYGHWREFMDGATRVVACASWCRDVLIRNGVAGDRVVVHRQALPGPARARVLRLPLGRGRPLRIGFFGRFCWMKGPDLLLEAARLLRGQGVEVVCELAGPLAADEQAWARRLLAGHRDLAVYHGVKRGPELRAWLGGLDLVAIPSRCMETGPLTLLEAWDEGVPVVGANLGGIREFLQAAELEEFLCEPCNSVSLARAMTRLAEWRPSHDVQVPVAGITELGPAMIDLYQESMPLPVA